MSSRRRRSDDFTTSVIEYQRKLQEEENPTVNIACDSNFQNLEQERKDKVIMKSNDTIFPDTTIYKQVSNLRSQMNIQKQNLSCNFKNIKTLKKIKTNISTKTSASPITDALNKIRETLEIKNVKDQSKSRVESGKQEPSKLWNALSTYNRSLNADKNGVQSHQKVLTRLSQEFHSSPTKFTEKLVTIIEESVMPSISEQKEYSGVSIHRMTQEFRKLCKFIEDESMPEWALSPDVIFEEQIENQTIELVDNSSLEKSETFTSTPSNEKPGENCTNTYTETPTGILKLQTNSLSSIKRPVNRVIKDCRFNDTNNSFEFWENMCNGVFMQQRITPQGLRRSLSLPESPTTRMKNIKITCERQMASLDDTVINETRTGSKSKYFQDFTEENNFSSKQLKEDAVKSLPSKKYFSEQNEETKMTEKNKNIEPDIRTPIQKRSANFAKYSPNNLEDDLDRSLLAELAQKRQRCFETAKLIMEIDENNPTEEEGKNSAELIAKLGSPNKSLSLPGGNIEFLNTINYCMEYQDFLLKKRKTIFNIIQEPKSPNTGSGIALESNLMSESPPPPDKSKNLVNQVIKSEEKIHKKSPRRRFFVTPGKSPQKEEMKKKKEYFPQMENIINNQPTLNHVKKPRSPEIRKNIYEYVKSPVAEYIKGTDLKLVKNIQAKNNDWLLTPKPLGIASESNENRMTPLKHVQESSALKFNLSPVSKKNIDSHILESENVPEKEFKLPKIVYKTPTKIQMIQENSENELKSPGLRVKTLLKSAEKKIVIRHEGRVANPRKKDNDEIADETMDTSIHVKTIAKKTNFIKTRSVR